MVRYQLNRQNQHGKGCKLREPNYWLVLKDKIYGRPRQDVRRDINVFARGRGAIANRAGTVY
jgi:hypothetical protein